MAAFGTCQVELFAQGTDNAVWQDVWSLSASTWSGWSSLGGDVTSSPSAAPFGAYQMQVYAQGTDGQVYQKVWTAELSGGQWTGNGSWSGWSVISGTVVGAPAATQFGDQMQIFAQGTNTEVYANAWNNGDTSNSPARSAVAGATSSPRDSRTRRRSGSANGARVSRGSINHAARPTPTSSATSLSTLPPVTSTSPTGSSAASSSNVDARHAPMVPSTTSG